MIMFLSATKGYKIEDSFQIPHHQLKLDQRFDIEKNSIKMSCMDLHGKGPNLTVKLQWLMVNLVILKCGGFQVLFLFY